MVAATPVALDHNLPEPLLRDVAKWLPEFGWHQQPRDARRPSGSRRDRETRLTVVAIEGASDDPVFARGVLLRDLRDVLKGNAPRGMYVRIEPSRVRLERARIRLTEARGADWTDAEAEVGRSFSDRQPYPPGQPYLVR
jgi:hypothetical protein